MGADSRHEPATWRVKVVAAGWTELYKLHLYSGSLTCHPHPSPGILEEGRWLSGSQNIIVVCRFRKFLESYGRFKEMKKNSVCCPWEASSMLAASIPCLNEQVRKKRGCRQRQRRGFLHLLFKYRWLQGATPQSSLSGYRRHCGWGREDEAAVPLRFGGDVETTAAANTLEYVSDLLP